MRSNSILEEADKIVYGDREKTYGHPAKNLLTIAGMWEHYLYSRGLIDENSEGLRAEDVAVMMILLKCARLGNQPDHKDSIIDIAGYAALIERVEEHHEVA